MRKASNIPGLAKSAEPRPRHSFASLLHGRVAARLRMILIPLVLLSVGYMLIPLIIWACAVERAGSLMEQGMVWPQPRLAESLPIGRDQHALEEARAYLAIATYWRPNHAHAYRLLGHAYAASGEWIAAAKALEQARMLAPRNPLPSWEAGLIYRHMQQIINHAPFDSLMARLSTATANAATQPISTPLCRDKLPASCYAGTTLFYQPYAAFPNGPMIRSQVLFLHAPATIEQQLQVPADQNGLRFVIGLDPAAHMLKTDGATFRVWVTAQTTRTLVYEHTIDRNTALQGWVPGWANLAPWAGQTITLTIESHPGPYGDNSGDWYGWGNIGLTTPTAAQYTSQLPRLRMLQNWHAAQLTTEQIKRYDR